MIGGRRVRAVFFFAAQVIVVVIWGENVFLLVKSSLFVFDGSANIIGLMIKDKFQLCTSIKLEDEKQ